MIEDADRPADDVEPPLDARAVVAAYDFSGFRTLIDVGGGNGALMATILAATPRVCGASSGEVGKALDSGAPARHSSLPFDR